MRVGLIGFGAIGQELTRLIADDPALQGTELKLLLRPGRTAELPLAEDLADLIDWRPDLIIEAAGHAAVRDLVPACLSAGIATVVASIGALADAKLNAHLLAAARSGGAQLVLPAGALGGIDLLAALAPSGITSVIYEGRKPPRAWKGTPAETEVPLDALEDATVIFDGSAREAAVLYPRNANVAATLALAGPGFEDTRVRLIADPATPGNLHSYTVRAGGADYRVEVAGTPAPGNPRTSLATVYSLLREIRNRSGPLVI